MQVWTGALAFLAQSTTGYPLPMNPHWQGAVESERAIPLDAPGYLVLVVRV